MKEKNTVTDRFTWTPMDQRQSRFGGGALPPRNPETRTPLLWLARDGNEVYLVNDTDEILDAVASDEPYTYRAVKPKDAVKVEEYDDCYDLDYLMQVSLRIQSEKLGGIELRSPAEKGGVGETVLLWDSGEAGKNVFLGNFQES